MAKQAREKQERVIEAVRMGLEGDAAVEFVHRSGFSMNTAGIARNLRNMGGRGRIQALLGAGKSSVEVLEACFPEEDFSHMKRAAPSQGELFGEERYPEAPGSPAGTAPQAFETTKLTLKVPTGLHEAIGFAAKAEGKKRNDLIVEILTSALSRMPEELK
jgi:predicted HicB family RNase H-like nuclease